MLSSNAADVAALIDVQKRVFVQVLGLRDFCAFELDVKCVCILDILDLHGLNDRSKKAFGLNPSVCQTQLSMKPKSSQKN